MSAVDRLVIRGRKYVIPQSGAKPSRTIAADIRVVVSPKRRSQASANESPAPITGPLSAAITGFSTSTIIRTNSPTGPAGVFL
jgi:hypothetical protein